MTRRREHDRVQLIIDALGMPQGDVAVSDLIAEFGTAPAETAAYRIGEPVVLSQHLRFGSGGEIVLHDDAVFAVILHLTPTSFAPRGLDVAEWIPGIGNSATFADFRASFDVPWRFAEGDRYFVLDAAYLRPEFVKYGGRRAGDLQRVAFTVEDPKDTCRPAHDGCQVCRELVARTEADLFDLDGTIDRLIDGLEAGVLTSRDGPVPLTDLRLLHDSALLERVESQVTCTACGRVACLTLYRDSSPTFDHLPLDAALRRPHEAIPPVEEWGDAARIAAAREAMRYVDHEPGSWFLVEQHGDLYLSSRYTISSMLDDSCLIRLDDTERRRYHDTGRDSLTDLARRIDSSSPHREGSPFHLRDLHRHSDDERDYSAEFRAAIADHTWLARQKQAAAERARNASSPEG
ncbi:hypothetical protein [Microbacterium sp. WCS2018Hpa-23]|uniref:hypothetical protein n=1 Tax=Microbacterium sp. WCS2018Hpa-23 TaxID=3073634 RepID=UPI002882E1F1|nr:hypothetical protein [Microbacterium sp. WCS2018Hpa-23]